MSEECYSENSSQVPAGPSENMSAARSQIGTELTQARSVAVPLTAIRGQVRRLPEGVEKERASLLAAQLENSVPARHLARQIAVIGAR